jgi:hypothetical protein
MMTVVANKRYALYSKILETVSSLKFSTGFIRAMLRKYPRLIITDKYRQSLPNVNPISPVSEKYRRFKSIMSSAIKMNRNKCL